MKLIQRIGYYLGGFSLGLIILAFFLNGKRVSCDYGPDARVLKMINIKPLQYTQEVLNEISSNDIDTTGLKVFMRKSDVNFSKSKAQQKPCGNYVLEGDLNEQKVEAIILFCHTDSTATLNKLTYKQ